MTPQRTSAVDLCERRGSAETITGDCGAHTLGLKSPPVARKKSQAETRSESPKTAEMYLARVNSDHCWRRGRGAQVLQDDGRGRGAGRADLGGDGLDAAEGEGEEEDGASELEHGGLEVVSKAGDARLPRALAAGHGAGRADELHRHRGSVRGSWGVGRRERASRRAEGMCWLRRRAGRAGYLCRPGVDISTRGPFARDMRWQLSAEVLRRPACDVTPTSVFPAFVSSLS
jgi:hypothetical protein